MRRQFYGSEIHVTGVSLGSTTGWIPSTSVLTMRTKSVTLISTEEVNISKAGGPTEYAPSKISPHLATTLPDSQHMPTAVPTANL